MSDPEKDIQQINKENRANSPNLWETLGVHPDDEYEGDWCPVCCEEMISQADESGDEVLVCSHCGYTERY